jgi:hypothetical protein
MPTALASSGSEIIECGNAVFSILSAFYNFASALARQAKMQNYWVNTPVIL